MGQGMAIPLFECAVSAGFPSPAEDFIDTTALDLNRFLIKNPAATFILKISGDSMTGVGLFPGDMVLVDASITPQSGMIVVAVINGDLTIKRLVHHNNQIVLMPENPAYMPITIKNAMDFSVWGVVKHSIRFF